MNDYTHKNCRKNSGYGMGWVSGEALRLDRLPQLRLWAVRKLWNNNNNDAIRHAQAQLHCLVMCNKHHARVQLHCLVMCSKHMNLGWCATIYYECGKWLKHCKTYSDCLRYLISGHWHRRKIAKWSDIPSPGVCQGIWPQLPLMECLHFSSFTAIPSPDWERHGEMVLNWMYGEESKGNHRTQVCMEERP